ncbi:MAG: ankyrin repeat domain-containing protein [Sphingomonas sp.]
MKLFTACSFAALSFAAFAAPISATAVRKADLDVALCKAAVSGTPAQIKALSKHGAHLNTKCESWSASPLANAVQADKLANIKALLDAGADVNAMSADFDPAIDWARSIAAAKLLISRGANVNAPSLYSSLGETPLIDRAMKVEVAGSDEDAANHIAIAELLIAAGADVNATAKYGQTALLECVTDYGFACVKLLLDHGANPNPPHGDVRSPLSLAVYMQGDEEATISEALVGKAPNKQTFHDIEALLRSHGATE